ncbi:MAG: indole-3-glycerol-phosphate synthase [Microthrixaceae bacterium]|nr:indole-3-glycerol-phosphate synthase [Microthrixaceae bacterium]
MAATYLDRILDHHRGRAAADSRPVSDLRARCEGLPPTRGFRAALVGRATLGVIAEIKRRSPSKGDLFTGLDPAAVAAAYEAGGAACLSVLTDGPHFGGSAEDLRAARAAVSLPVLRKDFTVSVHDVLDARLMGADAVLLIVAALSDDELAELDGVAAEVGLDVLVETHDEAEVERAVANTGATLIGVNQRDLVTFEVDTARAVRVIDAIPSAAVKVAESGVRNAEDARRLAAAGYDAVLVGEHLVTAPDLSTAVAAMCMPRG